MNRPDWIRGMSDQQLRQFVNNSGQLLNLYEHQRKPDAATIVRHHMAMAWEEQLSRRKPSPFSNHS